MVFVICTFFLFCDPAQALGLFLYSKCTHIAHICKYDYFCIDKQVVSNIPTKLPYTLQCDRRSDGTVIDATVDVNISSPSNIDISPQPIETNDKNNNSCDSDNDVIMVQNLSDINTKIVSMVKNESW